MKDDNYLVVLLLMLILFGNGVRAYVASNRERAMAKELAEIKLIVQSGFYCGAQND